MERITIECLRCGSIRSVERHRTGECPRCAYVGWAHAGTLSEVDRRSLRERPILQRQLRVVG